MLTTTQSGRVMLGAEQVADLLVKPVERDSIAAQVSEPHQLTGPAKSSVLFPIWTKDVTAAWTGEGETIDQSSPELEEIEVIPSKIAAMFVSSSELMHDSEPAAINEIGKGIVRSFVASIDQAFFGARVSPNAPAGLEDLEGVQEVDGAADSLDWAAHAASLTQVDHFVGHPTDVLQLTTLKESDTSRRNLLGVDPTQPAVKTINGVPILESEAVTPGTIWAINQEAMKFVVRQEAELVVSAEAFFAQDRLATRGTMRCAWGCVAPERIVKVHLEPTNAAGQ